MGVFRKTILALLMIRNLELREVCYIDEKSLMFRRSPLQSVTGMEEMLHNEDLDVVTICTPSGLHAQQTILAAEHGVNVICEKPMATGTWTVG